MSQDIGNGSNLRRVRPVSSCGAFWCSGGLVVAGGVDGELAQDLAGVFGDDAHGQVLDQEQDLGAGVDTSELSGVEVATGWSPLRRGRKCLGERAAVCWRRPSR